MVIADRLRQLREEKKFPQGDIEKRTQDYCHATFRGSKTAIRCQPLKLWKNWRGPWKYRCIASFTTARTHPNHRVSSS